MEKSPARHNQEERYALANTTTVFDFAKRYVTEIVEKNCKDTRHTRRYLDNEIYPRLAEKAIKDVSAADVQDIVFRKRDEGAPASAAQIRNLFKRMFEYAITHGLITLNPALTIPLRFFPQAERGRGPFPLRRSGSIFKRSIYPMSVASSSWRSTKSSLPLFVNRNSSLPSGNIWISKPLSRRFRQKTQRPQFHTSCTSHVSRCRSSLSCRRWPGALLG